MFGGPPTREQCGIKTVMRGHAATIFKAYLVPLGGDANFATALLRKSLKTTQGTVRAVILGPIDGILRCPSDS